MNKICQGDFNTKTKVERAILTHLGVSMPDLIGRSKKREISYARDIYCYFLRKRTNFSQKSIGRFLDNRSHATVIDSVNNIKQLADVYSKVRDDIRLIDERIRMMGIMVG
jgi:chromosomal replication initiator protein